MSEAIKQIKPLAPGGAPIWEYDTSDYPDVLKVPMEDGHVITYRREVNQPEPRVLKCVDLIRIMNGHTYGGNKRKNRRGR